MYQPPGKSIEVGNAVRTATRVCLTGALVTVLSLTLTACPKDPYDADTWIDKLDDPTELERAITELSRLKDPKAIKALGQTWRKHNHPSRILRVIIDLADQYDKGTVDEHCEKLKGDPVLIASEKKRKYGNYYEKGPFWDMAVPFLIEAIEEFLEDEGNARAIENATVAADALGRAREFGATIDVEVIIQAATKKMPARAPGQRVRLSSLRALGKFKDDRATDTLIKVLNTKLEDQHINLFAAAADALAHARSKKAVKPLVRALFGISPVYQFCRRSLVAIGEESIPELIEVFNLKNKEMNDFAKANKFATDCDTQMGPKTKCIAPSNLEFKAASVLGDLHAKQAVPHLLAGLKKKPMPAFFDGQGGPGPAQHEAILDALKKIGDPSSADPILAYILDKDADEYLKPMAIDTYSYLTRDKKALVQLAKFMKDDDASFQVRMASGLTYGRLADNEKDLEPLKYMIDRNKTKADEWAKKAKVANKEFEGVSKRKEAVDKTYDAKKATKKQKDNYYKLAREFALKEQDKYISEGNENDYRSFQRTFEQNLARGRVGVHCKNDPACYVSYIDKEPEAIAKDLVKFIPDVLKWEKGDKKNLKIAAAERALLELAKMGEKAGDAKIANAKEGEATTVFQKLISNLPSKERFIRQGVLLALQHVARKPCTKCVEVLDGIIEEQGNQSTLNALTADARVWRYYFTWAK